MAYLSIGRGIIDSSGGGTRRDLVIFNLVIFHCPVRVTLLALPVLGKNDLLSCQWRDVRRHIA